MVQYFRPIILDSVNNINSDIIAAWVDPEDYTTDKGLIPQSHKDSALVSTVEMLLSDRGLYKRKRLVWAGDYAYNEQDTNLNLYKMCSNKTQIFPEESDMSYYCYLVNHSKRQFVSKDRSEKYTNLHPLPILTAETSNFAALYPRDHVLLGYWARDEISVEKKRPNDYVEIIFDLA